MKNLTQPPPRLARWFLSGMIRTDYQADALGDLEEEFQAFAAGSNLRDAQYWYWKQCVFSMIPFIKNNFYWNLIMFKNYVIITLRNIRQHKTWSLINIAGLALGLTVFLLIALWVGNELSYDRFHEHGSHLYQLQANRLFPDHKEHGVLIPGLAGPALAENFSEIRATARTAWTGERLLRYEDQTFYENGIMTVDPTFFKLFSFPMLIGQPFTTNDDLFSTVITQRTSKKYFMVFPFWES